MKRIALYLAAVNVAAATLNEENAHAVETKQLEAFNAIPSADPRDYDLFKTDCRSARDQLRSLKNKQTPSERAEAAEAGKK
jgi:hypothetical protein